MWPRGSLDVVCLDDATADQYDEAVDIRIGVKYTAREIELQLSEDTDRDELKTLLEGALDESTKVLWLTDKRGREVGVPTSRITYVELGSSEESRRMGFSG